MTILSLKDTLKELGEKVFDGLYEKASKNEKYILYLLSSLNEDIERKDILQISQRLDLNFSDNTIDTALHRLVDKGLVRKLDRSKYSLPDKIFREYILQMKGYDGESRTLKLSNLSKTNKI